MSSKNQQEVSYTPNKIYNTRDELSPHCKTTRKIRYNISADAPTDFKKKNTGDQND